ncbi:MAG: amidoligase family protein [Elusimicrobia bacterium]|nr:amidoligase family protein [Elusimicrobiota bacterium]
MESWKAVAVRDGSLPESGYEINTAPAGGYLFSKQIKQICEAVRAADGYANDTCGLHIHVDCQDFQYYDIRKVIKLYAKLEKPLFSIVGQERQLSRFSKPCGDIFKDIIDIRTPKKWEEALLTNLYGSVDEAKRLGREKYVNSRYHALNLHSWIFRGTIEFRHHHGTTNFVTITNWGILCAALIDVAFKTTEEFIDRLPVPDTKERQLELLKIVAPTEDNKKWVEERFLLFSKTKSEKDFIPSNGSGFSISF